MRTAAWTSFRHLACRSVIWVGWIPIVWLLAGCGEFYFSTVPAVDSGAGVTPLEGGEFRMLGYSNGQWVEMRTGITLAKRGDHYEMKLLDRSKTIVRPGDADSPMMMDLVFTGVMDAKLPWQQKQFLASHSGFSLASLDRGYSIYQAPYTYPAEQYPGGVKPSKFNFLLVFAKTDLDSVEIGTSEDFERCSKEIFGTAQECNNGTCKTVPRVKDFTDNADTNRMLMRKVASGFPSGFKPAFRLARVRK